MVYNEFVVISNKISGPFIFVYEYSHTKPWFNKHRIQGIPHYVEQKIGLLFKVYYEFSKRYHIFELPRSHATSESMKPIEFAIHAIV